MPFLICLSLTVNVRSLYSMQPGTDKLLTVALFYESILLSFTLKLRPVKLLFVIFVLFIFYFNNTALKYVLIRSWLQHQNVNRNAVD